MSTKSKKTYLTPVAQKLSDIKASEPVKPETASVSEKQREASNTSLTGILARLDALEKWRTSNFAS